MQGTLIKGKSIKVSQSYVKPNNNSLHTAQHFDPAGYVQSQHYQSMTPPNTQASNGQAIGQMGTQIYYPNQQGQYVYGMSIQPQQSKIF